MSRATASASGGPALPQSSPALSAAASAPDVGGSQSPDEWTKGYTSFREELVKKQNSNSENYDKSILTLASGGLGLSLAFIKDVVPIASVTCRTVLIQSWFLFVGAIVVTIVSFQTSQAAIRTSLDHAEKYYLQRRDEYVNARNVWVNVTDMLNILSGVLFVAAILWTAYFVAMNLPAPGAIPAKIPLPKP